MGKKDSKVSYIKEIIPTKLYFFKNKSHRNICTKNYYNISDQVSVLQLLLDNSKSFINNYDISKIGNKMTWIKKMLQINPNCTKNKSFNDN